MAGRIIRQLPGPYNGSAVPWSNELARFGDQYNRSGFNNPQDYASPGDWIQSNLGAFDEFGYTAVPPEWGMAPYAQQMAERIAAERNDRLMREALAAGRQSYSAGRGALMSGLESMQTYRPGGAAAMASPYYQNLAQTHMSEADFGLRGASARRQEAPDLMFRYREAQQAADRDRARHARYAELAAGGITALAGIAGGAGGAAGGVAGSFAPASAASPGLIGSPVIGAAGGAAGAGMGPAIAGALGGAGATMVRGLAGGGGGGGGVRGGGAGGGGGGGPGSPLQAQGGFPGGGGAGATGGVPGSTLTPQDIPGMWAAEHPPNIPTATEQMMARLDSQLMTDRNIMAGRI